MEKTLKYLACVMASLLIPSFLHGGTIVWDEMTCDFNPIDEYNDREYYQLADFEHCVYLNVDVIDKDSWSLTMKACGFSCMEYSNTFVLSNPGDVVCADYFDGISEYFFKAEFDTAEKWGDCWTDYPITVGKKEHTFIGYSTAIFYDPNKFYYGWFELGLDDDNHLFVVHSAYDIDGDPIVVGMLPAVPEPKSLQLAGLAVCALVALRRRMHFVRLKTCLKQ